MAVLVAFETERPEIDGRVVACVAAKQHAAEFEGEEAARPLVGVEFDAVFRNFDDAFVFDDAVEFRRGDGQVMVVLERDVVIVVYREEMDV